MERLASEIGAPAPPTPALRATHAFLLLGVGAATAIALVAGNGSPAALAPIMLVAVLYLVTTLPLRGSVSGLLFLLLTIDTHEETYGQWRTPLVTLGDMLHDRLDSAAGIRGFAVTGMEVALALLFAVWAYRRWSGSRIDGDAGVEPATILRDVLALYVAGVLFAEVVGLARGLPLVPWKLRNLLHPVLLAVLFLVTFRGPQDHRLLGRIVVAAACLRAILALVVQRIAIAQTGGKFASATNHGDSILFAVAAVVLVASVLERPSRRRLARLLALLPIVLVGMVQNERRLVWVMLGFSVAFIYAIAPRRRWKVQSTRLAVRILPIVLLYAAIGWNRGGTFFAPVQTLRGVMDTSKDRSAYWREVEIWNIALSMRERPLLGLGLGAQYTEHMRNDSVAEAYKEYREWPHNSVLGLLLLMGLFAFSAQWALLPLVVFLGLRAYRRATSADDRAAAVACIGAVTACLVAAWGDTGAHYPQFKILAALAIAVSAKLAVATGGWPARVAPLR